MKYDNSTIRRQDRLLEEERAWELLKTTEYSILSMIDEEGMPYGIPVNHIWDGKESVYIHCAPEGKKLKAITNNPNVSLCIVGKVKLLPKQFTTEYESIILNGTAHFNLSIQEKRHALQLLIDKLSPQFKELGAQYAQKSFHRVEIIRIDFSTFSGKKKSMKHND